ncbi:MAG: hypothetical protein WCA35_16305, partial [Kovacikia sp.]
IGADHFNNQFDGATGRNHRLPLPEGFIVQEGFVQDDNVGTTSGGNICEGLNQAGAGNKPGGWGDTVFMRSGSYRSAMVGEVMFPCEQNVFGAADEAFWVRLGEGEKTMSAPQFSGGIFAFRASIKGGISN